MARPAVPWQGWGRPLVVLGFTGDGEFLAYTRQVEYYPLETVDDDSVKPMKLVFGIVREARTGREHARHCRNQNLLHEPSPRFFCRTRMSGRLPTLYLLQSVAAKRTGGR